MLVYDKLIKSKKKSDLILGTIVIRTWSLTLPDLELN
jgi:hypothetical protein